MQTADKHKPFRLRGLIRRILDADKYVATRHAASGWRNQAGATLIASAGFFVMSLLNIFQHSYKMLWTTGGCCMLLLAAYLLTRRRKNLLLLRRIFLLTFVLIFTIYTYFGGNDGFASLWLVLAPYAAMLIVDLREGFIVSSYFALMLLLLFGPLKGLLRFDYGETFLLRFPFLYLINFAFACFIVVRIRLYQYELLVKQEELERLGAIDLTTGLLSRNSFNKYMEDFHPDAQERLCAVFIDVNGLHELNNLKGHLAGDRMLRQISDLCRTNFPADSVYRMGGDEILILCKNRSEADISKAAEGLALSVQNEGYSIACGVAESSGEINLTELVREADLRMLHSKKCYYCDGEHDRRRGEPDRRRGEENAADAHTI